MVVMIGCKAEGQPQDEAPQATESNEVEPTAKVGEAQPMSANETREPTQEELFEFFENAYNGGKEYLEIGLTGDDLIGMEVCNLYIIFMGNPDIKQPANIEAQYREWRLVNHPDDEAPKSEQPPESTAPSKPSVNVPSGNTGAQSVSNTPSPVDIPQDGYDWDSGKPVDTSNNSNVQSANDMFWNPWAGMTEEEKAAAIKEAQEATEKAANSGTSILQ